MNDQDHRSPIAREGESKDGDGREIIYRVLK